MPASLAYVNGTGYSPQEVDLTIDGLKYRFSAIGFNDKVEPGTVAQAGTVAAGRTYGKYSCDNVTMETDLECAQELLEYLSSKVGQAGGLTEHVFPILIMYRPAGKPVIVRRLDECRYVTGGEDLSDSQDGQTCKLEFSCTAIGRKNNTTNKFMYKVRAMAERFGGV